MGFLNGLSMDDFVEVSGLEWCFGCLDGGTIGWMDGIIDGWMGGWVGWIHELVV